MLLGKQIPLIWAMDKNNLIGKNNDLPWPRIREDMKYFQDTTMGYSCAMGRNTWDSIPERLRPLRGRQNIVLSRNPEYTTGIKGVLIARSIEEAIQMAETKIVFIIGGRAVYEAAFPYADRLYITHVEGEYTGDVYFPPCNPADWATVRCASVQGNTVTGTVIRLTFTEYVHLRSTEAAQ